MNVRTCDEAGCGRPRATRRGLEVGTKCWAHYKRHQRIKTGAYHGRPSDPIAVRERRSPWEQLSQAALRYSDSDHDVDRAEHRLRQAALRFADSVAHRRKRRRR